MFLRPFRLVYVVFIVVSFLATMSLVHLVVRQRWPRVRVANKILSYFCRMALCAVGVKPRYIGLENLPAEGGTLLVGNHLTYVDVLVIASQVPTCFVTSTEIKHSFGLGQICRMAGCLFVERRNRMNIRNEVSELAEGLQHDLRVAIFPEATSTNGEQILRFRKALFMAAISAEKPVVPFCLNYRTVGGEPINTRSRDNIFWYGDMDFVPHLLRLTGSGGVEVELHFLPPLAVHADTDASMLAHSAQEKVESVFLPVKN